MSEENTVQDNDNDNDNDTVQHKAKDVIDAEHIQEAGDHHAPGSMVLVLILLISFVVYYFANWKALADVWHVR